MNLGFGGGGLCRASKLTTERFEDAGSLVAFHVEGRWPEGLALDPGTHDTGRFAMPAVRRAVGDIDVDLG